MDDRRTTGGWHSRRIEESSECIYRQPHIFEARASAHHALRKQVLQMFVSMLLSSLSSEACSHTPCESGLSAPGHSRFPSWEITHPKMIPF